MNATAPRAWTGPVLALALAALAPLVAPDGYTLFLVEQAFVLIAGALSLNLLVGYCGLISLGHSALFALGAYTLGIAEVKAGLPFSAGLALAAVIGALVGLVLAFPSLRLGRYTLAMVTLGYALVSVRLPFAFPAVTGGGDGLHGIHGPTVGGAPVPPLVYAWLLGAFALGTGLLLRGVIHSPYGRAMIASEDSAPAAASLGVASNAAKLTAFVISSTLASVAGALFVVVLRAMDQDTFGLDLSVQLLLMVLLGGAGTLAGPVFGAVILLAIPVVIDRFGGAPGAVTLLIYSVVVMIVVVLTPHGIAGALSTLRRRRAAPDAIAERLDPPAPPPLESRGATGTVLQIRDLAHVVGGLRAVDGVSLAVDAGTIHGLIGPNGAGKTTLINCVTAFVPPTSGTIAVCGRVLTSQIPADRPAAGIVRTFQHPETFGRLSCLENVLVALDRRTRAPLVAYVLSLPLARRRERAARERASAVLRTVGLAAYAERRSGDLPPGLRQMLSIARALAADPIVLLLDEPAGGLNESELSVLEATLRALRARGLAIVLIDHNAEFVMRVCDTVTVVDYGKVIAAGPPSSVRRDPRVIAAYLGEPLAEKMAP